MKPKIFFLYSCLLFIGLCGFQGISFAQDGISDSNALSVADSVNRAHKEAPVAPFNDTIFNIYAKLGPYTPQERANNIERKIQALNNDYQFKTDSLVIISFEGELDITFHDLVVMTVTSADARYFNLSKEKVADYYKDKIAQSIVHHRSETSLINILKQIGLIILIILVLFFLVKYTNRLFNYIHRKVETLKGTVIKGISFKSYNVMDEEKATNMVLFLLKLVKYVCIILLFYLALPLLFSVFPETRDIADKLLGYITTPLIKIGRKILSYIPNIITIIIIVVIFRYLIRGVKYLAEEIDKGNLVIKGFYADWAVPTYNIVRTLLYAFMFIIIFPYLPNADSKIFQGVSVFIGVIVSLGSTSLIGNVVSGLVLTYMRPFKVGDHIQIGDIVGTVIEKTPFVTRIKTHKNEEITIPNSNVMAAHTINFTASSQKNGLILHTSVTIGYDAPWRQVHSLLIDAANKTAHILKSPEPFVLQKALNDFYVEYQINAYTINDDLMMRIYSELHQNIQDAFNEAGVEIMSPHYRSERDGNQTTIPEDYLPKDYKAPSFRVEKTEK